MITGFLKVVKLNINLCGPKSVLIMINIDGSQEFLTGLLVINKLSLWDNTGIQHLVSMDDLLKCFISSNKELPTLVYVYNVYFHMVQFTSV